MSKSLKTIIITVTLLLCAQSLAAQNQCLTQSELSNILSQVNSQQQVSFNKRLSEDLIKLKAKSDRRLTEDVADNKKPDELIKRMRENRKKAVTELCQILKMVGWPSKALVGPEGVQAAFFLLRDSAPFQLQHSLLPVIIAATKQGEIPRPDFAAFIDLLRLRTGSKQLFGTQATLLNGFLVLYPIEEEVYVDARRKQYGMGPLAWYIKSLEQEYRLPLIKSTGALTNSYSNSAKSAVAKSTSADLFPESETGEFDVVRVETNLVSVNVSIYSEKSRSHVSALAQDDFAVSEDGQPQAISFFATTEVPFDLVLLLDLSGSTADKRTLIRKSTVRFIEAARPSDRIAIVVFSDVAEIISPLTGNRAQLLSSAGLIEGGGGSKVWDALKFTLDHVLGPKSATRRRAVVFMTDGVDNSLGPLGSSMGSSVSFSDLLEAVRRNDALIVPIYLDTESNYAYFSAGKRTYENARRTLQLLADESGGLYYKARKIEDLDGVYQQVIDDLGKVYSLGYKPTNEKHDGSWRGVKVDLPTHPELKTRTRPGYYAN
jgi:VWFA-related protein